MIKLVKKIAFVEIRYHETLLSELSKLFLQIENVEPTLFISKEVFKRLDDNIKSNKQIKFVLYNVPRTSGRQNLVKSIFYSKSVSKVSRNIKNRINESNFDLVIFETLQGLPFLKASYKNLSLIRTKKAAVVHNADVWAGERRKGLPFFLKVNDIFSYHYYKKWLHMLDFLIALEDEQAAYIEKKINFKRSNIITLRGRFVFEEQKCFTNLNENIIFTIPGTVEKARRNYDEFLHTFEKIAKNHREVRGYLLGRMMEKDIRKYILSSQILKEHIEFWDKTVPSEEFEKIICKSHFIVLPVAGNYKYGITKITGPLYDALVNSKPVIISDNVYINPKYADSIIIYKKGKLSEALEYGIDIVKKGEYNSLIKKSEKVRETLKVNNFLYEAQKMLK